MSASGQKRSSNRVLIQVEGPKILQAIIPKDLPKAKK
jgi:hypothetical protein